MLGLGFAFAGCFPKSSSEKYISLSKANLKTLENFLEAILPKLNSEMPHHSRANVIRRLDEELSFVDESIRSEFQDALLFIEWYPLISFFRFPWSKFSQMDISMRQELIRESCQEKSGIVRAAFSNIRMLGYLFYYGNPATWEGIGYDGPFGGFPQKDYEQRQYYRKVIQ